MRILAISGSLREASYNTALARAASRARPAGVEVELYDGLGLPPYDEDDRRRGRATAVAELRQRIDDADALLVVTPEYNGSIPGVLKNAIDWASRPPRGGAALWGKTVAVAGATTGQYGAIWAQQDLRRVLGVAGRARRRRRAADRARPGRLRRHRQLTRSVAARLAASRPRARRRGRRPVAVAA